MALNPLPTLSNLWRIKWKRPVENEVETWIYRGHVLLRGAVLFEGPTGIYLNPLVLVVDARLTLDRVGFFFFASLFLCVSRWSFVQPTIGTNTSLGCIGIPNTGVTPHALQKGSKGPQHRPPILLSLLQGSNLLIKTR